MLKYVVVAVFSICALPSFAVAQDCGCGGAPTMAAPEMVMDMGSVSDCGCNAAPAPAADCGCNAAPAPAADCGGNAAPRTRKKLSLSKVSKEVCRLQRVCSTDCCGCPKSKMVRTKKTITRSKLSLVDAPARERCGCAGGRLKGLLSKLGSCGGGCGGGGGGGCGGGGCGGGGGGCDAAPAADFGYGAMSAPVADCGCGS